MSEQSPDLPTFWKHEFKAVYPDGSTSDFNLNGTEIAVGDALPGKNVILDRWEWEPKGDGWLLVGHLREPG